MSDIDVYKEWLGIPEGNRPPDYYSLLRLVQFEDDAEKIQNNYRKLNAHVRKYATGQYLKQSQDLLNELAKAMLCLTDPDAKRDYDGSQGREVTGGDTGEARTVLEVLVQKVVIDRPPEGAVLLGDGQDGEVVVRLARRDDPRLDPLDQLLLEIRL